MPLIDSRIPADKAILAYTQSQEVRAQQLGHAIRQRGIQTQALLLKDAFDVMPNISPIVKAIKDEKAQGARVICNVTCATKAMSIALYQAAQETQVEAVYLTPRDQLIFINSENKPLAVENNMTLDEFFSIHGYAAGMDRTLRIHDAVFEWIGAQLENDAKHFITQIVKLREPAFQPSNAPAFWDSTDSALVLLAKQMADFGLLRLVDRNHISFDPHPASIQFFKGGWLEMLTFYKLKKFQSQSTLLQDVAMNVITTPSEEPMGTKNEIDIALLYNNQLHIIECKATGGLTQNGKLKSDAKLEEVNAYLYKLDTLKYAFGGQVTDGMLITTQWVSEGPEQRAKDYQINILDLADMGEFNRHLHNWLNQTNHGI